MRNEPNLYIVMRNDLPSLNPGKLAAQAAHVANVAARALPAVETVAPKVPQVWETTWIAGRKFFWNGVKWVKTYSNEYLVK